MEIRSDKFKNTSDFEGRSGSATLNMEKLYLFMDNMISNYNYPELAVLREWVSNAHDAHVAAGIKAPVKVTLPTALNPTLTVQDFGLGMSADFVENSYLSFGTSTKDGANDEIGGFGQGGKSALALSAQYTMTTISEGLKNIYIFERSPMGGVDFKNPIHNLPTDEPSGVIVQVAVDNWQEFTPKNLNRVLSGWSNEDIDLVGNKEFFSIPDNSQTVEFELDCTNYAPEDGKVEPDIRKEKGYVLNGALDAKDKDSALGSALGLQWDEFVVLVGPVAYVFSLGRHRAQNDYMVASVNIGDVSFPSSREVIEGSRSNKAFLERCFESIVDGAVDLLQKRADGIKSYRDALTIRDSPLAKALPNVKINYQGGAIPLRFSPSAGDLVFAYTHVGNWRGVKDYRLAVQSISADSEFMLNIEMLVVLDDDQGDQAIRNNVRLIHADREDKPKELNGHLVIAKKPSNWLRAAARTTYKSSKLAEEAKEIRRKKREAAAAAKAAGTAPVAPVRKTRKDRIGEYGASYLDFTRDENGKLEVKEISTDLMDFHDLVLDRSKKLVLTSYQTALSIGEISKYLETFDIDPSDAQFLHAHTGSKTETLRILLGSEDELKIVSLEAWIQDDFSKLAKFTGRSPKEIAAEIPFDADRSVQLTLDKVGLDTVHPKYSEILAAYAELEQARNLLNPRGHYYGYSSIHYLIQKHIEGLSEGKIKERPEFFFLSNLHYYAYEEMGKKKRAAIRQALNQMMHNWLDNLALEEAEAEDAAAESSKSSAAKTASGDLQLTN